LKAWLQAHNIQPPDNYKNTQLVDLVKSNWDSANAWTAEQYANAQKHFADVKVCNERHHLIIADPVFSYVV
jgi:hypothetical protein